MRSDLARILDFPTVALGSWPTPISLLSRSGTPGIMVKRDDLSGHGRGGVKTRKIEHLVGDMLVNGYDEFITAVGNVTNLIHDILPVLQHFGLRWQVFISDDPPLAASDRERIFANLSEHVHFVGKGKLQTAAHMIAADLTSRKQKHRPFLVLPSLAHPAGVVGSARGFIEMVSQLKTTDLHAPSTVFITAASGTTLAGFLLAENVLRCDGYPPIRIIGVQVYPGNAYLWTLGLIRWTERFLGLSGHVPADRVELTASKLYGGFGRYPVELVDLCQKVHEETGLNIDPIFGGKTWSAMESHLAQPSDSDDRAVLYWHCGYTPDWQLLNQIVNNPKGTLK